MLLNEKDVRFSAERRKQLQREAYQERLAKEARRGQRRERQVSPLWARVWMLFL